MKIKRKKPKLKKLLLLFAFVLTSACSIGPYKKYYASETELTLLKSGVPVPNRIVTREVKTQDARRVKETQLAVTDDKGIAKFTEVTGPGFIKWASITRYVSRYYVKTAPYDSLLGTYYKINFPRYTDIGFPEYASEDTVLLLECDMDSLEIRRVN